MTVEIALNCTPCMGDKHDECTQSNCRCENDNHGIREKSLKDGVRVDFTKPVDIDGYIQDVKDANGKINHEPKTFTNHNYDLVADIIGSIIGIWIAKIIIGFNESADINSVELS